MVAISIDEIKIVDRHRTDLGDVASLAASMSDLGQLQPIVVTTDRRLIAGERRLTAARTLGWTEIDAKVVDNLNDATALLRAERDENTCRKAFTPTEEHTLYEALLELEAPRAQERMTLGKGSLGSVTGKAKESVAEIVSGSPGRHKTLDKIGEIKRIASDESYSEHVRKTASEALTDMDRTGNVSGSATRVKLAAKADEARRQNDPETWPDEEQELLDRLKNGETIVVSKRENHARITQWARAEGLLVPVDRNTEWGNPFEMPHDGDRETVISNYRDHYLPNKPSLTDRLRELRGKALACWCAPEPCHADVLKERAEDDS